MSKEFKRMQELAGLTEIKVSTPGANIDNLLWTSELYEFFKNDQDIFKDSKIDTVIRQNLNKIIDDIWEDYTAIYQQYDIEDFNEGGISYWKATQNNIGKISEMVNHLNNKIKNLHQ